MKIYTRLFINGSVRNSVLDSVGDCDLFILACVSDGISDRKTLDFVIYGRFSVIFSSFLGSLPYKKGYVIVYL